MIASAKPWSRRSRITFIRPSTSCGASRLVGSSRISVRAPHIRTLRISACWRSLIEISSIRRCGWHAHAVLLGEREEALLDLVGVEDQAVLGERERDVLKHGERRDQAEVLEDEADARLAGLGRRVDHGRNAVDQDLALVGDVDAVERLGERGLAGAVLAEQGVDFAAVQLEVDRVVGDQRAEALGQAADVDGGRLDVVRNRTVVQARVMLWRASPRPCSARGRARRSFCCSGRRGRAPALVSNIRASISPTRCSTTRALRSMCTRISADAVSTSPARIASVSSMCSSIVEAMRSWVVKSWTRRILIRSLMSRR